jgi:arabinan endo-1,5-alpha-L-arabinosidase
MNIGTPGRETWLRISHRVDQDSGEHEYRAATSRNGRAWTWGGTWTMPPDARPQLGLVSMGGDGSTSRFEYFKVKRP